MPENTHLYQERVASLRKEIAKERLDGYIIPRTDEFQSEFLAPYAQRLRWISGFTGSAGSAVILHDEAMIMSDGRYSLQLRDEVDNQLFDIENSTNISIGKWLNEHAMQGSTIGYDLWLHTPVQIEQIKKICEEKGIKLRACTKNLVDLVWFDKPARPAGKITLFPDKIAGKTAAQKCDEIAAQIKEKGVQACLISAPDSLCWLLNVRGSDVDYSPLVLSYVMLHEDGSVCWFIDPSKLKLEITDKFGERVKIYGLDALPARLSQVKSLMEEKTGQHLDDITIWIDRKTAPIWFEKNLNKAQVNIFDAPDPCILPKAIKTSAECEAVCKAHIEDGAALTRFLKWIDENQNTHLEMDELTIEQKLEELRRQSKNYKGPSFATIAGFASNGAIVHYRANKNTNKKIRGDNLLLLDSGGQYHWGTTDITRTIAIGTPTQEMRENYTRVLKGHIAVASAVFHKSTTGAQIDALARKYLIEAGLDYAHGTGHGVGCYSCVHENSTSISPREERTFAPGMLVSNEPGYYKEGEYGIRIESLVLARQSRREDYYCFETISFAPFDPKLIVMQMLSNSEKLWLESYLKSVNVKLRPLLNYEERAWLESWDV